MHACVCVCVYARARATETGNAVWVDATETATESIDQNQRPIEATESSD
jgi:hypothetical protein